MSQCSQVATAHGHGRHFLDFNLDQCAIWDLDHNEVGWPLQDPISQSYLNSFVAMILGAQVHMHLIHSNLKESPTCWRSVTPLAVGILKRPWSSWEKSKANQEQVRRRWLAGVEAAQTCCALLELSISLFFIQWGPWGICHYFLSDLLLMIGWSSLRWGPE